MANPALAYAEETLGVHAVFAKALETQALVEQTTAKIPKLLSLKRHLAETIADREVEITSDERGRHIDLSQAALDRHLKEVFRTDAALIELRERAHINQSELDSEEYDLKALEHELRLLIGRMTELGGYFNYLAVTKYASVEAYKADKADKAEQTGSST